MRRNFYAVSGALLGAYEGLAVVTGRTRFPTISTWAAQRPHRRAAMIAWVIGLAIHIALHSPGDS